MEKFSTRATHVAYAVVLILLLMALAGMQGAADLEYRVATAQSFLNLSALILVITVLGIVGVLTARVVSPNMKLTVALRLVLVTLGASYLAVWSLGAATTRLRLDSQMRLQVGQDFVFIGGMIGPSLPAELKALIHPSLHVERVRLSGAGGDVDAAIQAAVWLRQHGVQRAIIEGDCASACAILALLLPERYLAAGGALGFHGLKAPIKGATSIEATREAIFARLAENGVPSQVVLPLLQGSAMHFPPRSELLSAGLVMGCWSPERGGPVPCPDAARDKTN